MFTTGRWLLRPAAFLPVPPAHAPGEDHYRRAQGDHNSEARHNTENPRCPVLRRYPASWKMMPGAFLFSNAHAGRRSLSITCSTQSPLICLVVALTRFQALIVAIEITSAASWGSE